MGLNCGCPAAAALPSIVIPECAENMGQIQKVIFQRIFATAGVKNSMLVASASPLLKASWTALLSAVAGTKVVVSPYIMGPTNEPGAARTFGGGNATLGGVELIIGREPSSFTSMMYSFDQATIAKLKALMCENLGVYLVDENGRIGALADDMTTPTKYFPIPIAKLFIGDKKLGGIEEPDSNVLEFSFFPNWSDTLKVLTPTDFNPLTDLVNV